MIRSLTGLSLTTLLLLSIALGQGSDSVSISPASKTLTTHAPATACTKDYRNDRNAGVVVSELVLEGATVGSDELSAIKTQIEGRCFDDQSDLIGEAIHAAFSDRGFARADVENVTLKASDSLAVPKPVTVKAEVTEGPRFRIGTITFIGNQAFSQEELRAALPIKKGDLWRRSKLATGFEKIRQLYIPKGYEDVVFIPDTLFSSTGTVDLRITMMEGPQYHMGELKVYAKKEISDRLASEWALPPGAVFNGSYPQTFFDQSHSLPRDFSQKNMVIVRNCPEALVTVLLVVDQTDPGLQNPPKAARCEKDDGNE